MMTQEDPRTLALRDWLSTLGSDYSEPVPASEDASFRRYFRAYDDSGENRIIMDAPPPEEDCLPFVEITHLLRDAGVHAPEIIAQDIEQGFLLLEDLGDTPYLDLLQDQSEALYSDAVDALIHMQTIDAELPHYDADRLRIEMDLFTDWYLGEHLGVALSDDESRIIEDSFERLITNALEQPQVFVHRDYHSRNLMVLDTDNPGVIDYQDAVIGPITYDLVSLFKDCYIEWPRERVIGWLQFYLDRSGRDVDFDTFLRWFDLMGLQRHIKVLGIFCRLNYRDGKAQYLDDLPLTLRYTLDACRRYPEFSGLTTIFDDRVVPHPKVTI